jgi:hypothetical protein
MKDYEGEREHLRNKVRRLWALRRSTEKSLREIDLELGHYGRMLMSMGVSQRALARDAEASAPHVGALARRSEGHPWIEKVPILDAGTALEAVGGPGRIRRVMAAFNEVDLLLGCGLDPEAFRHGDGLLVPNMMWQAEDGGYVGIDDVNVGYGGTGPHNAHAALLSAGLSETEAGYAFGERYFDLRPGWADPIIRREGWFDLRRPRFVGSALVVEIGYADLDFTFEHKGLGSAASSSLRNARGDLAYQAWLGVLDWPEELTGDAEQPRWLAGERVARVFTDADAAMRQGFISGVYSGLGRAPRQYDIVVEQGRLQLWVPTYPPDDPTLLLSREAYEALSMAGMYPREVAEKDARRRSVRYLAKLGGGERPPYIDISSTGQRRLSHVPQGEDKA